MRCPFAEWHPSPNYSYRRIGAHRGVVFHHIVGSIAAAESRFLSSSGGASAHFGIGYDGRIVQWVDTDDAAWHACQANYNGWIGFEHESPPAPPYDIPLTPGQIQADARLMVWLHSVHPGIPIKVAGGPWDSGISYHSANPGTCSTAWGQTGCPGVPIINDRQKVVDLALGGTPVPTPALPQEEDMFAVCGPLKGMTGDGVNGNIVLLMAGERCAALFDGTAGYDNVLGIPVPKTWTRFAGHEGVPFHYFGNDAFAAQIMANMRWPATEPPAGTV